MLEIGYGHTVTSIDDPHIRKVDNAVAGLFATGNPGSMLVDFFPMCESRLLPRLNGINIEMAVRNSIPLVSETCASLVAWCGLEANCGSPTPGYRLDESRPFQVRYGGHGTKQHSV